jgi:hypothetical protein
MNFLPRYFSKYYSDNEYTTSSIINSEIYFAPLSSFNDPFENIFNIKDPPPLKPGEILRLPDRIISDNAEYATYIKEYKKVYLEEILLKTGVACFTIDPYNFLMWSHYANSHTGLCIMYFVHKDYAFFKESDRVEYKDELPIIQIGANHIKQGIDAIWSKSNHWKYEQEFRMIKSDIGAHKYKSDALHSVIFGCKMTEKRREEFAELIYSKNSEASLFYAEVHPTKYKLMFYDYVTKKPIEIKLLMDYEKGTNVDGSLACIAHLKYECFCEKCKPGTTAEYWLNQ